MKDTLSFMGATAWRNLNVRNRAITSQDTHRVTTLQIGLMPEPSCPQNRQNS